MENKKSSAGGGMESVIVYFKETKEYLETRLAGYMANNNGLLSKLYESVNYSLFSGGKRIRPLFAYITGDLFEVPREKLTSLACGLEMIHTASLIMDDLPHMDDAATRRGKPANHLIYGQDVAALASIGLLTKAYEIVLADPGIDETKKTLVVGKLANIVGMSGLVGGQFVDLKFSGETADKWTLEYIHNHKTAALFVASGTTAAIIGDALPEQIRAIEEYAGNMGFAFQILDDLLDGTGSEEELGKSVQKDKGNFVLLFGPEKCRELVEDYTKRAVDAISIFGTKGEKLIALAHMLLKRRS